MTTRAAGDDTELAGIAGRAAVAGGVLGLGSLVVVLGGELTTGEDFMATAAAQLAGWAGFVASGLLVVGLLGLAVRYAARLTTAGRWALLGLGFAAAMTVGAASTLALVVPSLVDRAPALVEDPPSAVPPVFVLSGLAMGVCGIVLALGLRRSGLASRAATTMLLVGSVVTMVPLPSRFFLLTLAVGFVALAPARDGVRAGEPAPATA